jgi:hypothetical protein
MEMPLIPEEKLQRLASDLETVTKLGPVSTDGLEPVAGEPDEVDFCGCHPPTYFFGYLVII